MMRSKEGADETMLANVVLHWQMGKYVWGVILEVNML